MLCTHCRRRLVRAKTARSGVLWVCPDCKGRAVSIALLRRSVDPDSVRQLWSRSRGGPSNPDRRCPSCTRPMVAVNVSDKKDGSILELDVCRSCQFVWFDSKELSRLPKPPPPPVEPELPERAREILARDKIRRIAEQAEQEAEGDLPENPLHVVLAFLGLPIEREAGLVERWPLVTWTVAAVCVLVFLLTLSDPAEAFERFGMIPAQTWRLGGLTLLTSFFLHVGPMHLLGNMYFLLVFGDNVEDYLGKGRFLLLLLAATVAGDLLHISMDPRSYIPCVGASGGISGVIAFYALAFPRARLGLMIRYGVYFRWAWVPAWGAFLVWVLLQILGAWLQLSGLSGVSALAHLGGAGVGVVFWLFGRRW